MLQWYGNACKETFLRFLDAFKIFETFLCFRILCLREIVQRYRIHMLGTFQCFRVYSKLPHLIIQ